MERRDYQFETSEGSSLVVGVLVMVVVSSFVGMFIIVGSPFSSSSALAPQAQIQPVSGGVEVTASQLGSASHLLVLCGNSSFTLSEGESGILYEPACETITVSAVADDTRSLLRSYEPPQQSQTSTLVVASDGSGSAQTLAEALEIAEAGDTIVLRNTGVETQYAASLTIEKPVVIRSDTGVSLVTRPDAPLRLEAAGVTLDHVQVRGDTQSRTDVLLRATERVTLTNVDIVATGPGTGLTITDAPGRNQLSTVTVSGTGTGIILDNSTVEAVDVHTAVELDHGVLVRLGPTVGHVDVEDSNITGETGLRVSSPAGTAMTVNIEQTRVFGRQVAIDLAAVNDAAVRVAKSSIEGSQTGVRLGSTETPVFGEIVVSQSTLSVELTPAVEVGRVDPSATVDFAENWWGRSSGPPDALQVTDSDVIDIRPWCTDTACATLS